MTLVTLFTLAGFAALLIKLAGLQAVSPDRYAERARDQRLSVEVLPATRGAIVDRNGEPLVTTVTRKTIYTDPANVDSARIDEMAAALAPLLGTTEQSIGDRLRADSNFQYLARKVDDATAEQVIALGYRGIYTLDEATRLRPAGDLAESVVGAVDTENVGISGIEQTYDELLTGVPGEITQERSLGGDHTIPDGEQQVEDPVPGSTVMLTLDRNLQQVVEGAIAAQVKAVGAKAGTAVVMDRASGEILALASMRNAGADAGAPAAGQTATDDDAANDDGIVNDDLNRAITTTFDPGSVMKLVTMAESIENGLVAPWTVRDVPASVDFYDATFRDDYRWQPEKMTVTDILARSSNVGTMMLADQLGPELLSQGIEDFGFGRSTGVGLEHEEAGQVPPLASWSGTSLPTLAIGQGLTATPLQLLAAYNTVANGGEYVSPTMVRSIVSPDGKDATRIVADRHRVVSEDTAAHVQSMLAAVVRSGTGVRAVVPGYEVAGKTGTAWKARAGGGYGSDGDRDYLATFVGFAPATDPRFSIVVVIDEPKGSSYSGGLAAAPVFSTIARQALLSYDIPPDATGWTQPADGTNLRARAAEAPPEPPPSVPMAADRTASTNTTTGANAAPRTATAAGGSSGTTVGATGADTNTSAPSADSSAQTSGQTSAPSSTTPNANGPPGGTTSSSPQG